MPVKVEAIARLLSDAESQQLENLDVGTLRSWYEHEFNDNFVPHAIRSLSLICPVCLDNFPPSQMDSMFLCDHKCCTDCLQNYYRHIIPTLEDRNSLKALTCFQEGHDITEEDSMNFFQYLEVKVGRLRSNSWRRHHFPRSNNGLLLSRSYAQPISTRYSMLRVAMNSKNVAVQRSF